MTLLAFLGSAMGTALGSRFSFRETTTKQISGELQSVDGYMNIALEDTKEYVDGKLRRNYGDAFVRGNNGRLSLLARLNAPSLLPEYEFIQLI